MYNTLQEFLVIEHQNTQDLLIENSSNTRITADIFGLSFDEFVSTLLNAIKDVEHDKELCASFNKMHQIYEIFDTENTKNKPMVLSKAFMFEMTEKLFKMKARVLIWNCLINSNKINNDVINSDERQDEISAAISFWNDWHISDSR